LEFGAWLLDLLRDVNVVRRGRTTLERLDLVSWNFSWSEYGVLAPVPEGIEARECVEIGCKFFWSGGSVLAPVPEGAKDREWLAIRPQHELPRLFYMIFQYEQG
jgi:hypothetical protein